MANELPLTVLPEEHRVVKGPEELLRSVMDEPTNFQYLDGALVVLPAAFRDREREPSVDRLVLLASAQAAAKSASDGLLNLIAAEVRAIDEVTYGDTAVRQDVDPVPRPVEGNHAHAVISHRPTVTDSTFKKLRKALARLAERRGWTIPPASRRT